MRAQSEHRFRRGQRGTFCLRKRIPLHLRDACPRGKAEILVKLRTSDDKRRAFTQAELDTISGSPIYTQRLRSRGQSGEASYRIACVTSNWTGRCVLSCMTTARVATWSP